VSGLALRRELSLVRPEVSTATELLRQMAAVAEREGYVHPGFADAVVDREARFPTGLPTPVPAAIPHTDPDFVVRPGLVAALLHPPVEFVEMASVDRVVNVRLAIMLLVEDPQEQVHVLGAVVATLQDPGLVDRLAAVGNPAELVAALAAPETAKTVPQVGATRSAS
jgi:PTS system galactitol-specific IIA component